MKQTTALHLRLTFFSWNLADSLVIYQGNTESGKKVIVAARQGNLLATAFHPELTADTRWYVSFYLIIILKTCNVVLSHYLYRHSYFLKMLNDVGGGTSSSIVAVGAEIAELRLNQQPKLDLPIFQ